MKQKTTRLCDVEGCYNKYYAKGFCVKHYAYYKNHGKVDKTRFDKNDISIINDYAEIIIFNKKGEEKSKAIIDLEEIEKIKNTKWCLSSNGYVCTNENKQTILLHRVIMNAQENEYVDHINRNRLDCRKENLQIVTMDENNKNHNLANTNTSGVTGVYWNNNMCKWGAYIGVDNKTLRLGHFISKEEAIITRLKAEKEYNYSGENKKLWEQYNIN